MGETGSTAAVAMTVFALLLCLPLVWYVLQSWRPLRVDDSATTIGRGWRLTHVTGEVLAIERYTGIAMDGCFGSAGSGLVIHGPVTSGPDVHNTLNLRLADGRNIGVRAVNFDVLAVPGQIVSFWTAHKGGSAVTLGVLNHTTGRQNVNHQQVFGVILSPAFQVIFLCYLLASGITVAILSLLARNCVPPVAFFLLSAMFVIGWKKALRQFGEKGMAVIWQANRAEAQALKSQQH